jgi:hypothetical protein
MLRRSHDPFGLAQEFEKPDSDIGKLAIAIAGEQL